MKEIAPAHYTRWNIQPIEFIRANQLGFAEANIIKYVLRHDEKDGLRDLLKAKQYLEWMIEDHYGDYASGRPEERASSFHTDEGQVRNHMDLDSSAPF